MRRASINQISTQVVNKWRRYHVFIYLVPSCGYHRELRNKPFKVERGTWAIAEGKHHFRLFRWTPVKEIRTLVLLDRICSSLPSVKRLNSSLNTKEFIRLGQSVYC